MASSHLSIEYFNHTPIQLPIQPYSHPINGISTNRLYSHQINDHPSNQLSILLSCHTSFQSSLKQSITPTSRQDLHSIFYPAIHAFIDPSTRMFHLLIPMHQQKWTFFLTAVKPMNNFYNQATLYPAICPYKQPSIHPSIHP